MRRTCTSVATTAVVGLLVLAATASAQAPPSGSDDRVRVPPGSPELPSRDEVPPPPVTVPSQGVHSPPAWPPPPETVPSQGVRSTAPPPPRVVPTQ